MTCLLRALAISVAALGLGSCVSLPIPDRERPASADLRKLNGGGDPISLGTVYVLNKGMPNLVLDVLTQLQPNDDSGGQVHTVHQEPGLRVLTQVKAGDLQAFCARTTTLAYLLNKSECRERPRVEISVEPRNVARAQLANPFLLLEVLNRPVSGLAYNREAEEQVMQWRTSLAGAIGGAGQHTAVCTDIATAPDATLVIRGKVDHDTALSLAKDLLTGSALHVSWEEAKTSETTDGSETRVPIAGQLVLEATFREIGLVNASTAPRIDFTLGGFQQLTISHEQAVQ